MFPSMCIPSATKKHHLNEAVNDSSAEITKNSNNYILKFKVIEIYENVKKILFAEKYE